MPTSPTLQQWICRCCLCLLFLQPAAFADSNPVSAQSFFSGSLIPNAERRRLMRHILGDQWVNDAEVDDYFRRVGKLLAKDDDFLIAVADTDVVNAFAYISGIIVMYRGIWQLTKSEDEFLSIVAHEMGHIKLDHFQRQQDNAEKSSLLTLPILIAGIMVDEPDVREALIASSGGLLSNSIYAYSRELEHEADIFGLNKMLTAERDGQAMAAVFSRLSSGGVYEYLSTHPAPLRRGSYLADRLHGISPPLPSTDLSFYILREKLKHDRKTANQAKQFKRQQLSQATTPRDAIVARYGLLLLATKKHDTALGEEMTAALAEVDHPYVIRAVAENLLLRKKTKAASAMLKAAMNDHPQNPALAFDFMRLLERTKQHKEALAVYKKLPASVKERPDILHQAGKAAAYLNNPVLSNYLLASGQTKDGLFEQALKQIAVAEKFRSNDTDTIIALDKLKQQVEEEVNLLRSKKIQSDR